jgi:hypothetical protein
MLQNGAYPLQQNGCAREARQSKGAYGGASGAAAAAGFGVGGVVKLDYQLDFTTPGSSPLWARSRSWLRHRPKSR